MSQIKSEVESTFKSADTEEFLDIIFYRPAGYVIALASKWLGFTPNAITIFSIFIGIAAGHLFYYNSLVINITGIILLVFAEMLDSADGQLARMINLRSRFGRILDGFGGNLWFISIYIHLCLRYINEGGTAYIFLIAVLAGFSHSIQSAMADYYRNYYMLFVYGEKKSEIDDLKQLYVNYNELSWSRNFVKKFLLRVYINYTKEQEAFAGRTIRLHKYVNSGITETIRTYLSKEYKRLNKPLIKYCNILTTNTRMIVLILSILAGYPIYYFLFELTVLNVLLLYTVAKYEQNNEQLLNKIRMPKGVVNA